MHKASIQWASLGATIILLSGCATLPPKSVESTTPVVATQWQVPQGTSVHGGTDWETVVNWEAFYQHAGLKDLMEMALANNRDLRVSILNVERARAMYRIQRADQYPSFAVDGSLTRSGGGGAESVESYRVELGLAQFEIDLFGRVKQLSREALHQYLATEEAQHTVRLTLLAEVADAYLDYVYHAEALALAEETLKNYQEQMGILQERIRFGTASSLEISQTRAVMEQAAVSVANYKASMNTSLNALTLLVGQPLDLAGLGMTLDLSVTRAFQIPEGLPSELLLRRPDIRAAEWTLVAAEANLEAARLAFFPSIVLTGAVGSASGDLTDLFSSGTDVWSFVPRIRIPLFQGGRLIANRDASQASREMAVAQYERSIQQGFREVSDALTQRAESEQVLQANRNRLQALEEVLRISQVRFDAGSMDYYQLLEARRAYVDGKQSLLASVRQVERSNVSLYRTLGGGFTAEDINAEVAGTF